MFFLVFVSCVDGLAYFEKEISRYTVFNIIVLECMHVNAFYEMPNFDDRMTNYLTENVQGDVC